MSEKTPIFSVETLKEYEPKTDGKKSSGKKLLKWFRKDDKIVVGRQEKADFYMMKDNLIKLQERIKQERKDGAFAEFFETALVGTFVRYKKSKYKTWSSWQSALLVLATVAVPFISVGITTWLEGEKGVLFGANNAVITVAILSGILAAAYIEWGKNKNDKETWVRHSICYSRLNLLLQRYILKQVDYQFFVDSTYAILEQNLDQFALNLSSSGLAERPEVISGKDNKSGEE